MTVAYMSRMQCFRRFKTCLDELQRTLALGTMRASVALSLSTGVVAEDRLSLGAHILFSEKQ